jgi:transposase
LGNWVRQVKAGTLKLGVADDAACKVTPQQMEISRLRAEVARLPMERDIAKKAAAYFAQDVLRGTPGLSK